MKKEIKYIGFYDTLYDGKQYRSYSLAAAKKMDFICQKLNDSGFKVRIISPAYISLKGKKKYPSVSTELRENCFLELPPSREASNKFYRVIRVLRSKFWLFNYLIRNTKKDEQVLVYHNYNLALPVILAQKIKKFKIVLEIEEVYSKVWKLTRFQTLKEKMLLSYAHERSLVVSEVLAEYLKIKDPIVSYGPYIVKPKKHSENKNSNIKLIFSGYIDKDRGAGFLAVESMKYLPSNYQLFISGTVSAKDSEDFFKLLRETNEYLKREACIFLSLLDNKAYEELLLSADIALNPQKNGSFAKYVFPSKILTYMEYGLPIVSTRGESIVKSKIADVITFADGYDAKSIADAIIKISPIEKINYFCLEELSKRFQDELSDLFSKG